MLRNYLKIAWRNLLKHKTFSAINILGLAIGIAACLIIFIYVRHELTYDQYNSKADRIARVTMTMHAPESDLVFATSSVPLGKRLKRDYPEVESYALVDQSVTVVRSNNEFFREPNFYLTDQNLFSVFDFDFLEGSAADALQRPGSIVITSAIAKKYFGNDHALGKVMTCNGEERLVTGVVKNRPSNSDLQLDALLSNDFSKVTLWVDDFPVYTFVLFKKVTNLKTFSHKLKLLSEKYIQPELNKAEAVNYSVELELEPLAEVHFSKGKLLDTRKGNRQYSYVFSALAVFILIIAILNYINLSTARATERAKEVGIRKVSGAVPLQLIRQFLLESFLIIAIAWVCSIGLVQFSLSYLNRLLQIHLSVNWIHEFLLMAVVFVVTLFLAGLYPAFILSAFDPVKALKGARDKGGKNFILRKAITITQFALGASLIMGTTVIHRQLKFIEQRDLGYNKHQLLNIYLPSDSSQLSAVTGFQQALRQRPEVQGMTVGGGMTDNGMTVGTTFVEVSGKKRELMCNYFPIDPDFLPVFQIKLLTGRNLSDRFGTDKKEAFLVNEAFVRMVGFKSAIGQSMEGWGHKGKVVGVVKNFYYESLHNLIAPLVLVYSDVPVNTTTIKIQPRDLPVVKALFKENFPTIPMDYSFFDEIVNKQYEQDKITMSLFNGFTALAIFVCCLGLYGLVMLIAAQRSKEIGMRKILGASMTQLVALLTKDFMKLILWALLIGLPIAGVMMNKWLSNYAYHIKMDWSMFLIPAICVQFITLGVIGKEIIKATLANPVNTLRGE